MENNRMLKALLVMFEYRNDPRFISNNEIENFFVLHRSEISYDDFICIRDYFIRKLGVQRKVFLYLKSWFDRNVVMQDKGIDVKAADPPGFKLFREQMLLRRYSIRTIKSYMGALKRANSWFFSVKGISIDAISTHDAKEFFLVLIEELCVSTALVRMYRFAISFYYNNILKRKIDLSFLDGMKSDRHLPTILSRDEISSLLDSIKNVKHRTMIGLLYASGLRLSELINLRVADINLNELTIHVKWGKGRKDRITVFSRALTEGLCFCIQGKGADDFVFTSSLDNGREKVRHISARTVQKVLDAAIEKAGILRKATPHDLRHAFATHLLESGISLRHIQLLLGHKNITTTTIYTKVAQPAIKGIRSPL